MKDYSMNPIEKAKFILNYEIIDNVIVINFADGNTGLLPYSREDEDRILDIMKMQVLNTDEITKEVISNCKYLVVPFGILSYGAFMSMANNAIKFVNEGGDIHNLGGAIPFLALCLSVGVIDTVKALKYYLLLKDIDKNYLFMENNFYMNMNMRNEDKYLEGLSKKAKEIIANRKEEDNIFTFNSIDKMTYNDIKRVLENIKKYSSNNDSDYKVRKRR